MAYFRDASGSCGPPEQLGQPPGCTRGATQHQGGKHRTYLSPTSGPTTGGTSVTITGTGFTGPTAV
ncbi:IPT/TIG domain-containing protein [Nocardia sp. R16R-3T]